jgi:propanediol dehydratase small subunit
MKGTWEQPHYPLGVHAASELRTASERPLADLTLQAVLASEISAEDLRIHPGTLHAQAEIARQAGYVRLAANLDRAAELTRVPNEELLKMYEALRPGRSTYTQLIALAELLEQTYTAPSTGLFVREAAEAYRKRRLVRQG